MRTASAMLRLEEAKLAINHRNTVIDTLHKQLGTMETQYKNTIDDMEDVRFKYYQAIQDVNNLQEVLKNVCYFANNFTFTNSFVLFFSLNIS